MNLLLFLISNFYKSNYLTSVMLITQVYYHVIKEIHAYIGHSKFIIQTVRVFYEPHALSLMAIYNQKH